MSGFFRPQDPFVVALLAGVLVLVIIATLTVFVLGRLEVIDGGRYRELLLRCATWAVLIPAMAIPILAGPIFVVVAVGLLSLGCYREYARATGLFRARAVHAVVVLGIVAITTSAAHDAYGWFVAVWPLTVGLIAVVALLPDRPRGYLQRTSLAMFGFALFGAGLGYVGLLANTPNFQLVLLCLLIAVELNDVFAYLTGSLTGGPRLRPNTSPNKRLTAALGAVVLTTTLVVLIGRVAFEGEPIGAIGHLVALGLVISVAGQLGDLVVSSIKRDVRVKDMAAVLPGHGGLLDRFDSLLLVAPVVYYYIAFVERAPVPVGGG